MIQKTSILLLVGASFVASVVHAAESASKAATPPAPAQKQQRVVQVAALNSAEEYQQFQNNVQVMQNQRQACVEASAAMEKEKDPAKKKDLKAKLDQMLAKLNDDNQKMVKAYGFSLERNYTAVIDKARVFMLVTDEEATKIEKDQAAQAAAAAKEQADKDKAAKKK